MLQNAVTIYDNIKDKVSEIYQKLNLKRHEKTKGRKLKIPIVDSIALALYKQERKIETKKSLFEMSGLSCAYKTFVESLNRAGKLLAMILSALLAANSQSCHKVKHTDSTDIPVCLNKNGNRHQTMEPLSSWSKTGKGWFYGLKLHLTSDLEGRILALRFTTANANDRKVCREMNEKLRGTFVADAGYIAEWLERDFFIENERSILIIPRANMKKLATFADIALLNTRMKVEINFRNLKLFFGLLSSLPRSIDGYITNYLSSVLAFMLA